MHWPAWAGLGVGNKWNDLKPRTSTSPVRYEYVFWTSTKRTRSYEYSYEAHTGTRSGTGYATEFKFLVFTSYGSDYLLATTFHPMNHSYRYRMSNG
eukprot:scaffold602589_cov17-Prasinocladus_malaysianus.AAC.1